MNDDFNGHGPLEGDEVLNSIDEKDVRAVLVRTINRQNADERVINRLDREMRSLAAGTTKWQGEVNVQLERIANQMRLMTHQIQVVQYLKIAWPVFATVFAGSFVAVLVYLVAHK